MMHQGMMSERAIHRLAAKPADDADRSRRTAWLMCRAGTQLCALPIEHVIEIMRCLAIEPVAGTPPYLLGLSVIRGAAVPVVDAGLLVGCRAADAARLVAIRVGSRTIALAVQSVLGINEIETDVCEQLPPLLGDAAGGAVEAIAIRDAELLFFLRSARIVSEDILTGLDLNGAAS
jgi:purine-binding chemotaxis protein CheW